MSKGTRVKPLSPAPPRFYCYLEAGQSPATQVGQYTGGCVVNGEPFVAVEQGGTILTNPFSALSVELRQHSGLRQHVYGGILQAVG